MRGVAHDPVLRAKLMAQHEAGIPLSVLSERHGIARPVLSRWWARYQAQRPGWACSRGVDARIARRRGTRRPSPRRSTRRGTSAGASQRIADELGVGHGTVQRALERTGRNRLPRAPRRPVQRYEKTRPGELLHLDLKYLPALGNRPEFEYAAIDDFSREGARDDRAASAAPSRPRGFSSMCWRSCRIASRR